MKTELSIRNCPPTFQFRCPKTWNELFATADPAIRHCESCGQDVYFCDSDEMTIEHAKAGHCIAREVPDGSEMPPVYVGRPEPPIVVTPQQKRASDWVRREHAIDDSIRNAGVASRVCPACRFPAPNWRLTCRVCGNKIGRLLQE